MNDAVCEKLKFKLTQVIFLQEVITQSNSHEHDYSIHCAIFLQPVALRETKSISNIAHVLSGVSNVIDFSGKKEKETKNTIKLDLCFVLGGMQQCHF